MKQSPDYHNLARLAVIQHLRSYGIKIKHWNCKQRTDAGKGSSGTLNSAKVFGAPIFSLPHLFIPEYGNVPAFIVDVCKYLESHAHTEGLFRKSGSVVRQKLLKSKLDERDNDLSDARPCDVAGILKQFFRELPEPLLPGDFQDALCKAQQLGSDEEKKSATMLISCLMPERTVPILRYFFNFLQNVSMRSDANRMDSSNLAVIFAPNLLQTSDSEKISASTEKKLRVQAAIVRTLIDQAAEIGCVPNFLLEKIPGMLGMDVGSDTPGAEPLDEGDADSLGERKRRRRRSVGVLSSLVTPLILTPSTKRKLPLDSVQGISNKKRKSIKHNLTFELLPSALFGGGSTPSSAHTEGSPCVAFETSENCFSPSVSSSKQLSSSGNLRRSKRYENRKVQRMESGKTGCFSPKISRKEMVRRSLRLRFSLGKSSKEVTSGHPSSTRSQNIGWRLANSQELPIPGDKLEATSSPVESPFVSSGSKKISKSEENLLTPRRSDNSSHRMSWTGPHPLSEVCDDGTPLSGYLFAENCYSEPIPVTGKPPAIPKEIKPITGNYSKENNQREDSLCGDEECQAQNTVRRITQAFIESGNDLSTFFGCSKSSAPEPPALVPDPQIDTETLVTGSVIGIDYDTCSSEPQTECDIPIRSNKDCGGDINENSSEGIHKEETFGKDSTALETPAKSIEINTCQDSPLILLKIVEETNADSMGLAEISHHKLVGDMDMFESSSGNSSIKSDYPAPGEVVDMLKSKKNGLIPVPNKENCSSISQDIHAVPAPVRRTSRVSDHIQHFNRLCINDRSVQKVKSPVKFQRTPVRQSVRRINSLSEVKRHVYNTRATEGVAGSPMVKSVSYDGSLSSKLSSTRSIHRICSASRQENSSSCEHLATVSLQGTISRSSKQTFANAPTSLLSSVNPVKPVLEDLTNQDICRPTCSKPDLSTNGPNNALRILSNREHNRYRGSPKNPIGKVAFLPASKPLDL